MRRKRKCLSLILVFSMIMGLFAGLYNREMNAEAAEAVNQIELGTRVDLSVLGTDSGYRYPEADIKLENQNELLYRMSLSVDTGYMMTTMTAINNNTGTGTVAGDALTKDIYMEDLNTTEHFGSMHFVIENGATKQSLIDFIRQVRFYTEDGAVQKVCICATAIKELTAVNSSTGKKVEGLNFFDGHFYGYVSEGCSWKEAYKAAKETTFAGMTGYLLTLTSRSEDRFIHTVFEKNGVATTGWMGCTRATTENGYDGSGVINGSTEGYWDALEDFNQQDLTKNVWRWVCGPEAHIAYNGDYGAFGYQSNAWGYGTDDGGFTPYRGYFANWNAISKKGNSNEPNGGVVNHNYEEGYGYYGYEANGMWNDHPDTSAKGYYIEFGGYADDAQKVTEDGKIIVIVEKNSDDSDVADKPAPGPVDGKNLAGKPAIVPNNRDGKAGTVLTADLTNVGPAAAKDHVTYQWYTVENGTETPISGATGRTYTMRAEDEGKTFIVKVTGPESYPGELTSDELIPIRDIVRITNKSKKDDNGKDINREGTVLGADISGVNPYGSHSTLSYQWYTVENGTETPIPGAVEKNYILTSNDVDKHLVVKVTGNGKYYNTLASTPYDATRTNSDIKVDDGKGDKDPSDPTNPSDPSNPASDKMTITVDPTMADYVYTLEKSDGTPVDPNTEMKVVNGDGTPLEPDADGYYEEPAGGTIKFTELDKDETYVVIKKKKGSPETGKEVEGVVGPSIPDEKVKTDYDDKDTEDKKDDTITIIIDPALEDSVYAVQTKIDGEWVDIPVGKDPNGNYVPTSGGSVWTGGNENKVTFTELPADGTYKVIAKAKDGNIADLTPGDIIGGSGDIHMEQTGKPTETPGPSNPSDSSQDTPNAGTNPTQASQTPAPGTNPPAQVFTKTEEDAASKFIKDHVTGPDGKIITEVTDLTKDILAAGAADWKKLTAGEKAAVNARLQAAGCKFTFDQLLKKAGKYKIPGFKVIKFMKQNSKAKLKLIKCSGAQIACTTTNKKVATVDKKGVISAKKPGRATLTFTAVKGKYTNRLVIDVRVKKKFKNAKELTKFKSKVIQTPTVLVAKKRLLKKSSKIQVYDLEKSSKVKFTPINKSILTINNKGKYTGKKKGSTLVKVEITQNKKTYLLYVYVTIY